ncbi:hypothetical protein D3C80_1077890 [compost metagenome]
MIPTKNEVADTGTHAGGGKVVNEGGPGTCPIVFVTHVPVVEFGGVTFPSHGLERPKQHSMVYVPETEDGVVNVMELLSAEV